jgi:hypothetical protein
MPLSTAMVFGRGSRASRSYSELPRPKLAFADHSLVSVHLVFDSIPRAIALAEEQTDDFKVTLRGMLDAQIREKLHRLANAVFVL